VIKRLRSRIRDKAEQQIIRYARTHYSMIDEVLNEKGVFNHSCHLNCVQYVKDHPERTGLKIVEVLSVDLDSLPSVHYLVHDTTNGKYLDVTLGWLTSQSEHYLIRTISPSDYSRIYNELSRSRSWWHNRFIPVWWRWMFDNPIC